MGVGDGYSIALWVVFLCCNIHFNSLLESLLLKHNVSPGHVREGSLCASVDGLDVGVADDDFLSQLDEFDDLVDVVDDLDVGIQMRRPRRSKTFAKKAQAKQALADLAGEIAAIESELALLRGKQNNKKAPTRKTVSPAKVVKRNECLVEPVVGADMLVENSCGSTNSSNMPHSFDLGGEEVLGEGGLAQHPFYTELMMNGGYAAWDWDDEQEDKAGDSSNPSSPGQQLFNSSAEEGRSTMRSTQATNKRTRSRSSSLDKTQLARNNNNSNGGPSQSPSPNQSPRRAPAPAFAQALSPVTPPGNKRRRTRSTHRQTSPRAGRQPQTGRPAAGKKAGAAADCAGGLLWTREQLLEKIAHELPRDMLDGVVLIVNPNFAEGGGADDEDDVELDISTLDDRTLLRLQQYVVDCLERSQPQHYGTSTPTSQRKSRQTGAQAQQRTRAQQKKHPKSQRRKKSGINAKYNFIGVMGGTAPAEVAEIFRVEEVVKVDKAHGDSDEWIDIEGF
jgi:hypothetical protein